MKKFAITKKFLNNLSKLSKEDQKTIIESESSNKILKVIDTNKDLIKEAISKTTNLSTKEVVVEAYQGGIVLLPNSIEDNSVPYGLEKI